MLDIYPPQEDLMLDIYPPQEVWMLDAGYLSASGGLDGGCS